MFENYEFTIRNSSLDDGELSIFSAIMSTGNELEALKLAYQIKNGERKELLQKLKSLSKLKISPEERHHKFLSFVESRPIIIIRHSTLKKPSFVKTNKLNKCNDYEARKEYLEFRCKINEMIKSTDDMKVEEEGK